MKTLNLLFLVMTAQYVFAIDFPKSDAKLYVEAMQNDTIILKVENPTADTLYIFDTYFSFANHPYLHRYEGTRVHRKFYLELMPLVGCVGWMPHRIRADKLVMRGGLTYNFLCLYPYSSQLIKLPTSCLSLSKYYRNFDPRKNYIGVPEFTKCKTVDAKEIQIDLAVYKKIQLLANREWLQDNAFSSDPVLNKFAYDYVTDYAICSVSINR